MIQRLRAKFILINMAYAIGILAAVLVVLIYSNHKKHAVDSHMIMEQALNMVDLEQDNKTGLRRRPHRPLPPPAPLFILLLDTNGAIKDIREKSLSVTKGTAETLVSLVQTHKKPEGILKDYSLRFLRVRIPAGEKIVFLDQSYEINVMKTLVYNCLAIFVISNLLFFLLSLYLSHWALKPAELAFEQQNQFIADASHELKTPLTVILANLQILTSHRKSTIESQEKWLSNTREEAVRMKKLVEDLLFLARSDAGFDSFPSMSFDFSDAVLNTALLFESVAFEQKVELDIKIEPGILMVGNEARIRQLTAILLDNACKYASTGGWAALSVKKTQTHIILQVSNAGEPIPEEELSHIFERFYRTDKSRTRTAGGYGLGLSIAQTIALQHKSKISVSSSLKQGTSFTLRFPSTG